jgi:ATP-dependent RNA helicase SUPV3L1/SUV3
MPLLLKPAPTRLRLVLWSLAQGLQEFPESPPPGLVAVPAVKDAPDTYHTMCGYRAAGDRAIRIDMLERLADMLRAENSRSGFEANPDMLSITGMTLEQIPDLMQGLGYKAEKGERVKVKPAPVEEAKSDEGEKPAEEAKPKGEAEASEAPAEVAPEAEAPKETTPETEAPAEDAEPSEEAPEIEVFYTFTWAPKRQGGGERRKPQGKGKPRGNPQGKRPPRDGAKTYQARPPKKEKKIDPDNPFAAALMGLKDKG